jgi:hypothetical protein
MDCADALYLFTIEVEMMIAELDPAEFPLKR